MEPKIKSDQISENPFLQSHSALIRIWHWITFILITIIIFTVLVNTTLLNPRANALIVQEQLKGQGISVDDRQAFSIAHYFDDQLWNLHKLTGIGLSLLLLLRIVAELFVSKEERIKARLNYALKTYKKNPEEGGLNKYYFTVRVTYTIFYVLLLILVLTGISMAFGRQIGISRTVNGTMKEIHAASQWVMYAFILFHIGGVIIADLGKAKGVVSGMINGNK